MVQSGHIPEIGRHFMRLKNIKMKEWDKQFHIQISGTYIE